MADEVHGLTPDLIQRDWQRGPNAKAIHQLVGRISEFLPTEVELLRVAVALDAGDLPLVEQGGFADFPPVDTDHRLVTPSTGEFSEYTHEDHMGPATLGPGTTSRRSRTGSGTAEARASTRGVARRSYRDVGEVIAEDTSPLGLYFPQFSPAIWDPQIQLWYREGWLKPLRWWPTIFGVRMYYHEIPEALPLLCVSPALHHHCPHTWQNVRGGVRFRSLCYTFAPDGTIARGRSRDDNGAEVLRQGVMWLLRYLTWRQFGFWPGEDVAHDARTIERLTKPTDPCPAHNWRRYAECCRPRILAELQAQRERRYGVAPQARVA